MKNLILFFSFFQSYITFAQSVTIDPSNTATNIIDAKSTNQGITVPKMTTIQKGAIANKVEGMLVYDTDLKSFSYWIPNITVPNSGTWQNLSSAGGGANTWNTAGSDISNANGGNVGIGTSIPNAKLEINSGVLNKSGLRLTQLKYSSNGLPISKFADAPNPRGIVFDNFGNAYVSNFTDNKITKIFPNGFSIVFYENTVANPLLSGPHDLSIYNNKLYISNFQSGTIVEMLLSQNIYGGYSSISIYASGFNNPTGLTFDGSGNLFVVNWGNGNLSKISSTGIITQNFGTGLSGAFGCVYNNGNNKIYIANNYVNEIAEIDGLLGGAKTTFKPAINYCTGLTINDVGDMFVTQFNLNKVIKIKDNIISDYVNTDQPWGICLNANEKIFVVNNSLEQVSVVQDAPNEQLFVDSNGDIFKRSSNEAETHYLGESFGGGKIFYLTPNKQHGLITTNSTFNQIQSNWYNTVDNIGALAQYDTEGKNYTDWRLPTYKEMYYLKDTRHLFSELKTVDSITEYWCSTENGNSGNAFKFKFDLDLMDFTNHTSTVKSSFCSVRPVRSF